MEERTRRFFLGLGLIILGLFCELQAAQEPIVTSDDLLVTTSNKMRDLPQGISRAGFTSCAPRIMRGGNLAYYIATGRLPELFNAKDQGFYLNAIVDLIWYFYSEAINKNQAFNEGTFVIEDKDFRFYKFFMDYVKLVNQTIQDDPRQDPAATSSNNPFGYSRLSSHYTSIQYGHSSARKIAAGTAYNGRYRHYGIDIRFKETEKARADLLPTGDNTHKGDKTHILFGKINENPDLIFVKLERSGLYDQPARETLGAAAGILPESVVKDLQKHLPKGVVDQMRGWVDFDDKPENRKEHCPLLFASDVLQAVNTSLLAPDRQKTINSMIELLGVKAVSLLLEAAMETGKLDDALARSQLLAYMHTYTPSQLADPYPIDRLIGSMEYNISWVNLGKFLMPWVARFDYLNLRSGREVILTPYDFCTSRYYYELSPGEKPRDFSPNSPKLFLDLEILKERRRGALQSVERGDFDAAIKALLEIKNLVGSLLKDHRELESFGKIFMELIDQDIILLKAGGPIEAASGATQEENRKKIDERKRLGLVERGQVFGGRITLSNRFDSLGRDNPSPRLLIIALRNDQELWRAVLEHGCSLDIGSCRFSKDPHSPTAIRYGPYGVGKDPKSGEIRLEDIIPQAEGQDSCYRVTLMAIGRISTEPKGCSEHIVQFFDEAFPSVRYWMAQNETHSFYKLKNDYPHDFARYILGLPKGYADRQGITRRYLRLLAEWNPDMYPLDRREMFQQIEEHLEWAFRYIIAEINKAAQKK